VTVVRDNKDNIRKECGMIKSHEKKEGSRRDKMSGGRKVSRRW
jgi:hypothetical protein